MYSDSNNSLTTSVPGVDLIPCNNAEVCVELTDMQCIVYNGPVLPAINVFPGDRGSVILQKIATALSAAIAADPA